ncbi:unnamed protein product [Xylocopa violacea]|uniref:Odorant receptor n=1 Tax=Xylocopa violacea TaxID=135666 RepID=A0ABP1PFG1_XYLVO
MNHDTILDRYLKDKFYGQLIGIWPDQDRFMKYSARLIILVIINISYVAQISQVVVFYSFDTLTDQMPFLLIGFAVLLKQYNYILNQNKLRRLLHGIAISWLTERPKEELEILEKYTKKALILSMIYKAASAILLFMFMALPAIPPVLDIVMPLNESRKRIFIFPSYYFVDEEEYYYPILAHMTMSAFVVAFVFIACDLTLVHVVQHACALLVISGCEARWYDGSTKVQALYILLLRKCLSPTKLTGGGLIALNLDSFVQILKASFSYYTVLKNS